VSEAAAAVPRRRKRKTLSGRGRRQKGVKGEREVMKLFDETGFAVRGLEGLGDHIATKGKAGGLLAFHIEVKRQERVRVREWLKQCRAETPEGMIPLVCFRENGETWAAVLALDDLLGLVS